MHTFRRRLLYSFIALSLTSFHAYHVRSSRIEGKWNPRRKCASTSNMTSYSISITSLSIDIIYRHSPFKYHL
jgi:hypothetical protein